MFSHRERTLLILGSCWQNLRRNQGWAVPSAAPSNAGSEGWAEGFGVISCGFGVSLAPALSVEIPDILQNLVLRGFGLCLGWGMKTGMSLAHNWWVLRGHRRGQEL